ncbi:hypothetical protein QYF36_026574 [Acer negundo]|nr:hypothetical protein QYF36_026574 [Acer negundo]
MEKKMNSQETWKLADPDLFPPEYCPDAVSKYTASRPNAPNKLWRSLFHNVRKHLVFLGWRIDFTASDDTPKFRYTSPDGELFMSLREACQKLDSVTPQDSPNSFLAEQENDSDGDSFADKPECFPEAVVYWFRDGLKKKGVDSDMRSKAKRHLLAMKWKFWYADKSGRQELRYTSPTGKVYYSLRMACKGCIDEGGVPETILSASNLSSCNEEISVPSQTEQPFTEFSAQKRRKTDKTSESDLAASTIQIVVDLGCLKDGEEAGEKKLRHQPRRGKVLGTLIESRDQLTAPVQQLSRRARHMPKSVLTRLIESNAVLPMAKVFYRGRDKPLAEGCITHDGIKCNCCNEVFQLSAFEVHAGSKNHRPAANIFLEDGRSLVDCQRQVDRNNKMSSASKQSRDSRKRKSVDRDESCDVCTVCYTGGELILCDRCPAAFHKGCLGFEIIPVGDWFCPTCCCGICSEGKFEQTTEDSVNDETGRFCDQCMHIFHIGCLRKREGIVKLKNFAQNKWFCSNRCEHAFSGLHELIGKPISLGGDNITWRVLKSMESTNASSDSEVLMEIQSKLDEALDVMHECFESVKDPLTGKDLVADVIFNRGSDKKHLNFQGFYTVVLEKEGEVISVATVRVFDSMAEIPLVATSFQYRKHGMCRLMMDELEKQLTAIGVLRLILPSSPGVFNTWTTKFGYSKMTDSERLKLVSYVFLNFQDTILCQKLLKKELPAEESCKTPSPISEVLEGESG